MGLCVSKPYANDYATYSRDTNGELVINRRLVGVSQGEDITPRLKRLDRKAVKQMWRGKLPYQDFEEARAHDLQQSFGPSTSAPERASASNRLPAQIKYFHSDPDGYLIETTHNNPSAEDVEMARQQKAEMVQQLGAQGYATLRPDATETVFAQRISF